MIILDVAVIIPVYNNEKYIEKCINSLLNQKTDCKYEIIVINDGSTDNSLNILKKYKERIILIDKKNTGPGDSRNLGIKKSTGKYLMFVDSDDYVSDNFIEKMYTTIIENDADIVICDFYRVHRDNSISYLNKGEAGTYLKNNINKPLLMDFHSCNKIFNREILTNINYPENMFYEDVVFISKVLLKANKIIKINEPLYYYRDNKEGTTNVINITNYDLLKAYKMIEKDFIDNNYQQEIEFLFINGILVDLLIKIVKSNISNKKDTFYKIKNEVEEKYPNWYRNKYIKNCKITKRLYLFCLHKNYYKLINFIFSK